MNQELWIGIGCAGFISALILYTDLADHQANFLHAEESARSSHTAEVFWSQRPKIEVKQKNPPAVPDKRFRYYKTIYSKVTGYTPGGESCGIYSDGRTSIGKNAWNIKGVATAPKALPYGSWVYIPGVGYREVDDTGSAMRKSWQEDGLFHIDLRFGDVKHAKQWGVKHLNVHVFIPEND